MTKNVPDKRNNQEEKQPDLSTESVEDEVELQLQPVLSSLSKVQREQILSAVVKVVHSEAFSGPLPHPRHLEQYERTLPGGAERIFQMTELSLQHNMAVKSQAQKDDHRYRLLGMWLGFLAFTGLVAAAVYMGIIGQTIVSGMLLGASVVGSIGIFVTAHRNK